jgi:hypothetical protein
MNKNRRKQYNNGMQLDNITVGIVEVVYFL